MNGQTEQQPLPQLLGEKEWAKRLGVCRATLRRARQRGELMFHRLGDRVLYSAEDIRGYLESNRRRAR